MSKIKSLLLTLLLLFLTACGTETQIDPRQEFDLWDYLTSSFSYDVTYQIYENDLATNIHSERNTQFGDHYIRQSNTGTTTLFLGNEQILMRENTQNGGEDINVIRYVYLGDRAVFQSPSFQLCTFERFYDQYSTHGSTFFNTIQIACTSISGTYQEFYYAYDEGLDSIYREENGFKTEYVKIGESRI